jgi:prevent-host-death family protein
MSKVNIHEAKTNLSRLVDAVESGAETEVILARNGRPAARIVALEGRNDIRRRPIVLGIAKGLFKVPANIDRDNTEIERLFYGDHD